jgi:hypothetical protein
MMIKGVEIVREAAAAAGSLCASHRLKCRQLTDRAVLMAQLALVSRLNRW